MSVKIKNRITGKVIKVLDLDNLTNANLRGAYLTNANLRGADLTNAYLTDANLTGANLTDADLRGADLTNAYLTDADLRYAYLTDADLTNANLRGADLRGANLTYADLTNADLTNADLTNAYMPIYCKWNVSIINDEVQIGCKKDNIDNWDEFFKSDRIYQTNRNTEDFARIEAMYNAVKAYKLTMDKFNTKK